MRSWLFSFGWLCCRLHNFQRLVSNFMSRDLSCLIDFWKMKEAIWGWLMGFWALKAGFSSCFGCSTCSICRSDTRDTPSNLRVSSSGFPARLSPPSTKSVSCALSWITQVFSQSNDTGSRGCPRKSQMAATRPSGRWVRRPIFDSTGTPTHPLSICSHSEPWGLCEDQ